MCALFFVGACQADEVPALPELVASVVTECGLEIKERPVVATVQIEPGAEGRVYVLLHREKRVLLFDAEVLANKSKAALFLRRNWSLDKDVVADVGASTYLMSEQEMASRLRRIVTLGRLVVLP